MNKITDAKEDLFTDLPAQAQFIQIMEGKISQLLASKLNGPFKMVNYPNGFHYGFKYGMNNYYNEASLKDVDLILTTDPSTWQICLAASPFTLLYSKILANTGYHLSKEDQYAINQADIASQSYINKIISSFEDNFPNVPLPEDQSKLAFAFQYIAEKFGDIDKVPAYYSSLKNALSDYIAYAAESYQQHKTIINAQLRLTKLLSNLQNPSKTNGGMQVGANTYYPAFSLPDFAQTFASLNTKDNKIDINLEFSNFTGQQSTISIDHQAGFIIPAPICIFGTSSSSYSLNTFTTASSVVSINMSYSGITTLSPTPESGNVTADKGWYDDSIINEIIKKTGEDATGYCLINKELDVHTLFGQGKSFSRLKEFVISQAPIIKIQMTKANTQLVQSFFQHESSIDIDFFGFAVSSSTHKYTVHEIQIDSVTETISITLGGAEPSATVSVETEVAYLLGGVPLYPPETKTLKREIELPFSCNLHECGEKNTMMINMQSKEFKFNLEQGNNTEYFDLGNCGTYNYNGISTPLFAKLKVWYLYSPSENTIWLDDSHNIASSSTQIILSDQDGKTVATLSNGVGQLMPILSDDLNNINEQLVREAEKAGLTVIHRVSIPEEYKNAYFSHGRDGLVPLSSTYMGITPIAQWTLFANANNTSNDALYDAQGNRITGSWIGIWANRTGGVANTCLNCTVQGQMNGAHILRNATAAATPQPNSNVYIVPLCSTCNNYHNTGTMSARVATTALVLLW